MPVATNTNTDTVGKKGGFKKKRKKLLSTKKKVRFKKKRKKTRPRKKGRNQDFDQAID